VASTRTVGASAFIIFLCSTKSRNNDGEKSRESWWRHWQRETLMWHVFRKWRKLIKDVQ